MKTQILDCGILVGDLGQVHGVAFSPTLEKFYRALHYAIHKENLTNIKFVFLITNNAQQATRAYINQLGFKSVKFSVYMLLHYIPLPEFLSLTSTPPYAEELKRYSTVVVEREQKDKEEKRTGPQDIRVGDEVFALYAGNGVVVADDGNYFIVDVPGYGRPTVNRHTTSRLPPE